MYVVKIEKRTFRQYMTDVGNCWESDWQPDGPMFFDNEESGITFLLREGVLLRLFNTFEEAKNAAEKYISRHSYFQAVQGWLSPTVHYLMVENFENNWEGDGYNVVLQRYIRIVEMEV